MEEDFKMEKELEALAELTLEIANKYDLYISVSKVHGYEHCNISAQKRNSEEFIHVDVSLGGAACYRES